MTETKFHKCNYLRATDIIMKGLDEWIWEYNEGYGLTSFIVTIEYCPRCGDRLE